MKPVLLAVLLCSVIDLHGTKIQTSLASRIDSAGPLPPRIFVIAEGAPGGQRQQVNLILDEINRVLSVPRPLMVAWFDAEPERQHGFAVRGASRELIRVMPRTSMRDAMEIAFAALADTPHPHVMLVIAQQQFYPTPIPTGRLLELSRRSDTRVYTIHLSSGPGPAKAPRGFGRSARNLFCSVVERLALRERAYSERDTSHLLKLLSSATGGQACVAEDKPSAVACAASIGTLIEFNDEK
jgi:hypothetical protein